MEQEKKRLEIHFGPIPSEALEAIAVALEPLGYDGTVEEIEAELEKRYIEEHNL